MFAPRGKESKEFLYIRNLWFRSHTGNNGFTFTEQLVILSIIGTLVIALGVEYIGWIGRYKVEVQTKNLYSNLMDAKLKAMTRHRMHFMVLDTDEYQVFEDTDDDRIEDDNGDDSPISTFSNPKTLENGYNLSWTGTITFGRIGLRQDAGTWTTIQIVHPTPLIGTIDPDYNCVLVGQSRINMGKMAGDTCVEK